MKLGSSMSAGIFLQMPLCTWLGILMTCARQFTKLKLCLDGHSRKVKLPQSVRLVHLVPWQVFLSQSYQVGWLAGRLSNDRSSLSLDQTKPTKKEKHATRPPIEHNWSLPGT